VHEVCDEILLIGATRVGFLALLYQEVLPMDGELESKQESKPGLCERCGSRMPPQTRGRPRRWCSQQCRQSAYEERHGLESWKDKQPKVKGLSEVVDVAQSRGAEREAGRRATSSDRRRAHTSTDCLMVVTQDLILMSMVVEQVIDITRRYGVINTFEGRLLAERVAELINTVFDRSTAVVPAKACPGINPPTPDS